MTKLYDISRAMHAKMAVWPGDPAFELNRTGRIADGLAVTILGNVITAAGRAPVTFNNFEFVNIINMNGGGSITPFVSPSADGFFWVRGTTVV